MQFRDEITELMAPFNRLDQKKIKLIIHVGTPKTGTTSLQTYLDKKQRKLRGKGILYPHNLEKVQNPTAPRHHWFEKNLVTTHHTHFLENIKNLISQIKDDTHTIILSSEGIYNSWWDFPEASKELLSVLAELFDTHIWVWFREPVGFIESFYKQCVRNPEVIGNPCYGKNLSLSQMLEIEWFSQHLDYQGFVSQCEALFGKTKVSVFQYHGDIVQEVITKLGLATPHDNPTPRQNKSLNSVSIALLRTLNQFELSAKDKEQLMPHLKEINRITSHKDTSLVDDSVKSRILAMAKPIAF